MDKKIIELENSLDKIDSYASRLFQKLTPVNVESEKKKFLSSEKYNPNFRYYKISNLDKVKKAISEAKKIKVGTGPIEMLLKGKLKALEKSINLFENLGKTSFSANAKKMYGLPDENLVMAAEKILARNISESKDFVDSKEAYEIARKCLDDFGLEAWSVEYKDIVSLALVQSGGRKIYLKPSTKVPVNFLNRMIVHEIGTHVFRAENGSRQEHKIFAMGTEGYLETEEGLAANVEEMHGCLDEKTLKGYAGRVLAVDLASKKSFRETYDELLKYFKAEDAWQITLRVKRGLSDTSKAGCYTKDYLYLKGYYSVKDYLSKNKDGMEQLFLGKIRIEDVKSVAKIPNLVKPVHLPTDDRIKKYIKQNVTTYK